MIKLRKLARSRGKHLPLWMGLGPCFVTSGIWRKVYLAGWDSWHIRRTSIANHKILSNSAQLFLELEILSEVEELASIIIKEPNLGMSLKVLFAS